MEAVRDDEQSPPKAGRTGLPQGRLPKFLDGSPWHACLPRRVDIRSGVGVHSPGSHFWQFAQQRDNEIENEGLECMPYGEGGQKSRDRAGRSAGLLPLYSCVGPIAFTKALA